MSDTPKGDPWIAKYLEMEAAKFHALGVITYLWNQCETNLFTIFNGVSRIPARMAWLLTHEMGDVALSNASRKSLKRKPMTTNAGPTTSKMPCSTAWTSTTKT